jgi:hypothetical protein
MQNEFEKQVQQKMEELKFTPSAPVWKHIEEQIRPKKDRRRMIFWLPLLVLLAGGLYWWFQAPSSILSGKSDTVFSKTPPAADPVSPAATATHRGSSPNTDTKKNGSEVAKAPIGKDAQESTKQVEEPQKQNTVSLPSLTTGQKSITVTKQGRPVASEKDHKPNRISGEMNSDRKENTSTKTPDADEKAPYNKRFFDKDNSSKEVIGSKKEKSFPTSENAMVQTPEQKRPDSSVATGASRPATVHDSVQKKIDSVTTVPQTMPVKKAKPAAGWNWGIVGRVGTSAVADGLFLYPDYRNVFSSPLTNGGTPAVSYREPSTPKNGIMFSVGASLTKKLSRRISFSTGLQYDFYSTLISVGQMIRQDTFARADYSVASFYSNSGTYFTNYRNQYHFVSIPVQLNWQVARKLPLYIGAGLALQQLVYTNALVYSDHSGIYYKDKNAFHKTQLFTGADLQYRVWNTHRFALLAGPHIQYAITSLEKEDANKHLVTWGLKTQLQWHR